MKKYLYIFIFTIIFYSCNSNVIEENPSVTPQSVILQVGENMTMSLNAGLGQEIKVEKWGLKYAITDSIPVAFFIKDSILVGLHPGNVNGGVLYSIYERHKYVRTEYLPFEIKVVEEPILSPIDTIIHVGDTAIIHFDTNGNDNIYQVGWGMAYTSLEPLWAYYRIYAPISPSPKQSVTDMHIIKCETPINTFMKPTIQPTGVYIGLKPGKAYGFVCALGTHHGLTYPYRIYKTFSITVIE